MPVTINGGELKFGQRVKTGDFEWKEASATFTFSTPDGETASVEDHDAVAERVVTQVAKMLKITFKANPGQPRKPQPPHLTAALDKKRAEDAAAKGQAAGDDAAEAPVEDEPVAQLPDVTDKDIHTAVSEKMAAGPYKDKVMALIFKHSPSLPDGSPGRLRGVPQGKRREFLAELKEIA